MPGNIEQYIETVPKTKTGAIDLTKAERFAEGGTHILYRFPEAPFVIKLMRQNPNPQELEELERKYAVLYDCFDKDGKNRCIREQHISHIVLIPGERDANVSALSIVPYERCFKSKVKFDFKIEPAELDPYLIEHNPSLYAKANQACLGKSSSKSDFNLNDYGLIDAKIGAILQRLDNEPRLREVMVEFLNHYRDFYQRSNIILDAMGFENILFFKDEQGEWQFKIGSVIKHDTGRYTNELFAAMHSSSGMEIDSFIKFTHAYFSPANIRAVNACAMKLGLEPVIDDVLIDTSDLLKLPQQLSIGERMLAFARHGDFERMESILQGNMQQLRFEIKDFWAYSLIADEYIKHGQPAPALKKYLDIVATLPIQLPDNKEDAKRVQDAKVLMIDRKLMQDRKISMHDALKSFFSSSSFSFWSSETPQSKSDKAELLTKAVV